MARQIKGHLYGTDISGGELLLQIGVPLGTEVKEGDIWVVVNFPEFPTKCAVCGQDVIGQSNPP